MELRARIQPLPRRAAFAAACAALVVSALAAAIAPPAHAAKKKKAPVITAVAPKDVAVGEALTIRGRNFRTGRNKNSVVFKRAGSRAVFVKAEMGTKKMLRVIVPATVQKYFALKAGNPVPTRFRLRVLARKFGKKFTSRKLSPVVSGPRPPKAAEASETGDCDDDGAINKVDPDDDNDLLSDVTEKALGTDPCKLDTEGDGVEDGYEYQSAKDLNDDEHQNITDPNHPNYPNQVLPYPGKRPYPNPLFADATVDYDGDGLPLTVEQMLWRYTYSVNHTAGRSLTPLSYSDGMQYSLFSYENGDHGRRHPAQPFSSYTMQQQFLEWAGGNGYGSVKIKGTYWKPTAPGVPLAKDAFYEIRDVNLNGTVDPDEVNPADRDQDGWVSDDERDEDADGLWNQLEVSGPLGGAGYWSGCYTFERAYPIDYAGTRVDDADSDGDDVRDGADDQDHDDVPNIMEVSRMRASGEDDREAGVVCRVDPELLKPQDVDGDGQADKQVFRHPTTYGRINPFNPCLPFVDSRTCPKYVEVGSSAFAPFDLSPNWVATQ
jgi:hypothetical protein